MRLCVCVNPHWSHPFPWNNTTTLKPHNVTTLSLLAPTTIIHHHLPHFDLLTTRWRSVHFIILWQCAPLVPLLQIINVKEPCQFSQCFWIFFTYSSSSLYRECTQRAERKSRSSPLSALVLSTPPWGGGKLTVVAFVSIGREDTKKSIT